MSQAFTVKFHNKCKWLNGFNPDNEGDLLWYTDSPRPIKVLGCIDGSREGGSVSVLGSTPWYSRLKYVPLRLA